MSGLGGPFGSIFDELGGDGKKKQRTDTDTYGFGRSFDELLRFRRCVKCSQLADEYLDIYLRTNHKIFGPYCYCKKCGGWSDEKYAEMKKKQEAGGRIVVDTDRGDREKKKAAMKKEMDLYRRKAV